MPRPRKAHSATMSCRLSSTIMSATPNAYWRTCSMRCNHTWIRLAVTHCILLSSLCLDQTLTSSQSTAWCCKRLPSGATCVKDAKVGKQRPRSLHHTSPLPPLSRTQGRCHGEEKPAAQRMHEGTCNSNAIHIAPQQRAMRTAKTRRQ
ncbi:hypothetical protein TcCL_ESM11030 [Trypanosoma cruzi]|nr:hypothetical protein TcCL_ESM11030 [Trypanosoma cruzi]